MPNHVYISEFHPNIIGVGPNFPATPFKFQRWWISDSVANTLTLYYYNGTSWVGIGGSTSLVLENLASDPPAPASGRAYLNTSTNTVKSFINSAWQTFITNQTAFAGDVTGTPGATVVSRVNGIGFSGTPALNKYPVGVNSTSAAWGDLTLASYSTDPASSATGLIYLNSTGNKARAYINGGWQDLITSATAVGGDVSGTVGSIILPSKGTPGTYAYPTQIITDSKGAVTSVTAGVAPVTGVSVTGPIGNSGTSLAPNITWNPTASFSNNGFAATNFVFETQTSAPTGGLARAYVDTTLNAFRVYINGAWRTLADVAAVVNTITLNAPFGNSGTATNPVPTLAITPVNPGGAVPLQAATPGTAATGNANISGKLITGGDVAAVGNVSGVNVSGSGTVQGATVNGTTTVQVNSVNLNPASKNWLINGNMDVCQRYAPLGSAVVAAGGNGSYVLDRWRSKRDGTGATVTVSQQAFTIGQTAVPGEPTYFLRHAQTVAGTGGTTNVISQYIEDVRTLAGQTVTVSDYLKADASRTVNVRFRQFFGTGGSADVTTSNVAASVTTSPTKFTGTFSIPSVSGKTITSDSALVIEFQLPLNTAMTIELAQVQVEAGANAGAFQKRSFQEEIRDCYRYYRKAFRYTVAPANSISGGALLNSLPPVLGGSFYLPSIPLGTALWVTPPTTSATFYNSGGGTAKQVYNFTRTNSSTTVVLNAAGSSESAIAFQVTAFPVGWAANDLFSVAWTIDVDYLV
jgi:hypothetical protein